MEVFSGIKKRLEKISEFMNLDSEELELLLKHEKISHSVLNVNGKEYPAWRIIHNNALGPGKGGIRFHPDVSEDEIKLLSFWMSLKTSLLGLPFGGAKGGVKVNPKELTSRELEELSREYVRAFADVLGQDVDVPAPDVYTNSQIMAWMLDEYEKIKRVKEPAMITGKPVELGGLKLREDSTSAGGFIVLKEFLKKIDAKQGKLGEGSRTEQARESLSGLSINNTSKNNLKIAIQGFGNAGMNIAKMLYEEGFNIVAVSDSKGGVYSNKGLNINDVINIKKDTGSVQEFGEGTAEISNKELLELDVDLLILAALENQITKNNADNIKAKYMLELANGPITPDADEILSDKIIIPDILANAGGVLVSYFEWRTNKEGVSPNEKDLKKEFEEMMTNTFEKVWDLYNKNKDRLSMREASYVIAVKRILDGEKRRKEKIKI